MIIIDIIADSNIDTLDILISSGLSSNAISDTNIDIVNPIPANNETENTDNQSTPFGFSIMLNLVPTQVNNIIPNGLPTTKPAIIPHINVSSNLIFALRSKLISVLDNANNGSISKLQKGSNL